MATRNFVPRSGSEGQIGTQEKPWGVVVADIGHFATLSGSISGSQYSTGSFGRLHVAGDSNINGDVTIGGNINIGDSDTDSLTIAADLTSNLVPNADSTFNIGSTAKNWKIGHIEQISSTNITASSDISSSGNIFGTNLLADSSSVSTRLTAITSSISGLKTNSGSFSTRVTNLKTDSGSFSTRVTNLKTDSGSFSTRVTAITSSIGGLKSDSGSFSTRVTNLKSDSGSFSTRITDIVSGDITLTHVTSSGDVLFQSDLTVDGKVTAQEFHTEVVSSSIIFSSGSTIFGDTSDDTHRFTGSLKVTETGSFGTIQTTTGTIPTLLGNTTFSDNLTVAGNLDVADTIYHTGDSNTKIRFPEVDTIAFNTSGVERLRITSDGQISGSAVSTGSFGKLVVGDDIELVEDQRIYFEADKATYIESHASDSFRVVVNNRQMLLLDEDTGNRAVFGNGTKVYIGSDNNKQPDKELVVDGDISGSATSTGSFGHLVVQGNITASGTVRADAFESVTGGTAIDFNDSLNITGNLTASGDLSIDDLTASGNISGSVTSTGSFHHIKSNKIQSTDNGGLKLFEHGGSGIFVEDGGRVGIGDLSPESTLKITGDLTVSTNITASNNIKMGGKIVIDQDQPIEFHQTLGIRDRIIRDSTSNAMNMLSRANIGLIIDSNNDDADAVFSVRANGYTHAASTPLLTVTQQHEISGSAASTGSFGRLETAGDIKSDGRIFEQDTSVIDHATAMAIVFGG